MPVRVLTPNFKLGSRLRGNDRHFAAYNAGIRTRHILVAIGWLLVAAVTYLSLIPHPPQVPTSDKLSHFTSYGTLMLWFAFLYRRTPTRALYAVGFVAMGVAIEFLQQLTGRQFEVADMLANSLGVFLGWGVALVVFR